MPLNVFSRRVIAWITLGILLTMQTFLPVAAGDHEIGLGVEPVTYEAECLSLSADDPDETPGITGGSQTCSDARAREYLLNPGIGVALAPAALPRSRGPPPIRR